MLPVHELEGVAGNGAPVIAESVIITILHEVAADYEIKLAELSGRSRKADFVEARKDAAFRLRRRGLTLREIGKWLNRDHSTITDYLRKTP